MSTLDVGIVNVALPTIANQFGVSLAQVQWIVTSYLITMIALLPFFGRISDRLDRSKVYSWGFFIFSIGSLLIPLFSSFLTVIVARCIQGIGATMIMANSQAMVRQVFPDHERGKALGINAVVISIGTLSGPAIGGLLLEYTGWPVLFLINVPFGILACVLGLRFFPKVINVKKGMLDLLGSTLLAIAAVLFLLGTTNLQEHGASSSVLITLIAGVFLFIILVIQQKKIKKGIIDLDLFSIKTVSLGNASGFLIHLVQMAALIPITFYMQEMLKYSTFMIGMILSIQPLIMALIAPVAGWYRDKFSAALPLLLGPLLCAVSMLFIGFSKEISLLGISFHFLAMGAGFGLFQAINNAEIMSSTPDSKISLSGSLLALIRYFGMLCGTGVATIFAGNLGIEGYDTNHISSSIQYLFGLCFILCLVVVVLGISRFLPKKAMQKITISK